MSAPIPTATQYEIVFFDDTTQGPFASSEAACSWADDRGLVTDDGYQLRNRWREKVATVEEVGAEYPGHIRPRAS